MHRILSRSDRGAIDRDLPVGRCSEFDRNDALSDVEVDISCTEVDAGGNHEPVVDQVEFAGIAGGASLNPNADQINIVSAIQILATELSNSSCHRSAIDRSARRGAVMRDNSGSRSDHDFFDDVHAKDQNASVDLNLDGLQNAADAVLIEIRVRLRRDTDRNRLSLECLDRRLKRHSERRFELGRTLATEAIPGGIPVEREGGNRSRDVARRLGSREGQRPDLHIQFGFPEGRQHVAEPGIDRSKIIAILGDPERQVRVLIRSDDPGIVRAASVAAPSHEKHEGNQKKKSFSQCVPLVGGKCKTFFRHVS